MPMIRGKAYWAKIVGKPAKAYNPGEFEWSVDVAIDAETRQELVKLGVGDKVKNKGDDRGDFISFKRNAYNKNPATGARDEPAKPIKIVDHKGNEWDKRKIGNGSTVNVKFAINEFPLSNGKTGRRPGILALQVWDLVEFQGGNSEEFPTTEGGAETW